MKRFVVALLALLIIAPAGLAGSKREQVKRLKRATEVFSEVMSTPDKGIPEDLLDKAECAAIIPGMTKGGLGIGARYGRGIIMCRNNGPEKGWSAPLFLVVEGGSFGLQIGLEKVDLVMLIMNRHGIDKLLGDKFTLGADASVAAGPVGRHTSAETNARMDAQILAYSRAKGLFGGIALNGAVVKRSVDDNYDFYGKDVDFRKLLLENGEPLPPEAEILAAALSRQSPHKDH